jgi:hypothetical protein
MIDGTAGNPVSATALPFLPMGHTITAPETDVGTETRWRVRLDDGRDAVVGQLAPDLARDVSIRRRYARDVERVMLLPAHSLAPTLAVGPAPDPCDPRAVAPWRVRLEPAGEPLSDILARAPLPIDEAAARFAAIADAVFAVHAHGAVLRDLRPEQIVVMQAGHVVLVDVGLARVDVLSSHTASSLLLRGSAYVAPEQLMRTAVDQRSDVWSVGVMLWQAVTGTLPFGDGPPLLAEHDRLPPLTELRPDVPVVLAELLARCLSPDLARRPPSMADLTWVLRGGGALWDADDTTVCQHCGTRLHVGQRMCISCGRVAVRFEHGDPDRHAFALELLTLSEDAAPLKWLQGFLGDVSKQPMRRPEFVIGSVHMYSEEERGQRMRLPARLFNHLTRDTAEALQRLATEHGVRTRLVRPNAVRNSTLVALAATAVTVGLSFLLGALGVSGGWIAAVALTGFAVVVLSMADLSNRLAARKTYAHYQLRAIPAALPASDPLVARLAALLRGEVPADVRGVVGELALLVQRLVDHRATLLGVQAREVEVLTAPVLPIVDAVERHVAELQRISSESVTLDEGAMVRALAASEARAEPPEARAPILDGLDRLRLLEEQRAALFHRLLEARSLLERTVRMGLAIHDPAREHDRQVALALSTLGP